MVRELLLPLHMKPTAKRFLRFFVTILLPTISNRWAFALIIRVILCCMYNMLQYIRIMNEIDLVQFMRRFDIFEIEAYDEVITSVLKDWNEHMIRILSEAH